MWSDTLLAIERVHLLRFALWGGLSLLLGIGVLVVPAVRRTDHGVARHFAVQTALWGAVALAIGAFGWRNAALRDYDGAVALARGAQLAIRLDSLLVLGGLAVAMVGSALRRDGLVGAGVGIAVQGAGWLVLHLAFAGAISTGH